MVGAQSNSVTSAAETNGAAPSDVAFLAPAVVPDLLRVGKWSDGGYIVPYSAVQSADVLISFGLNKDWSFEENFHAINARAVIHGYDHTISLQVFRRQFYMGLLKWMTGKTPRAAIGQLLWLWRDFRAFFGSTARHYQEKIVGTERAPGEATLDKVFSRIDPSCGKVFLKIDIEGSEYEIIDAILRHSRRIIALVIEFHHTTRGRPTFRCAVSALQREFEIVHVHGNNWGPVAPDGLPDAVEITFVPRSGLSLPKRSRLPIELDRPNNPQRAEYPLRFSDLEADKVIGDNPSA